MSHRAASLLVPFDCGHLPHPPAGRAFFLRAQADPVLGPDWRDALVCEQSFKPDFDRLGAQGFRAVRRLGPGHGMALGLCALTKHKAESLAAIARGWSLLKPGGVLVAAGAVDEGAASILREAASVLGGETMSKHHCRIWWAFRPEGDVPARLARWRDEGAIRNVPQTGFAACPGAYGWNKTDAGSRLLADQFSGSITGRVADFGAGWGYLSARLLAASPRIAALDMVEAEGLALDAAEINVIHPTIPIRALWLDVAAGVEPGTYDCIVTNPPFHAGKAADPDLGRAFIARASEALVRGGTLLLVANRHLPYESEIDARFARRRVVAEDAAFKVIEAVKA